MKVDGGVFIDRTPDHFGYILDWLRDGRSTRLPSSRLSCDQLLNEARFYQIQSLSAVLEVKLDKLDAAGCNVDPGDLGFSRLCKKMPQAYSALQLLLSTAQDTGPHTSAALPDERKLPPASVDVHMRFGNEVGPGDSRIEPTHGKVRLTLTGCFTHAEYNVALPFRPGNDLLQLAARMESLPSSRDGGICISMLHLIRNLSQILLHLQRAAGFPTARCEEFHVCCSDRYGLARECCFCKFKLKLAG